ncbi:MAG: type I DNA topoisomerase, partial [Pseudomonadota bacterium]
MKVVVVESPAKAKTINKYLGDDYKVLASYGHIRDLPSKDGSVDPDNDFEMVWEADSKSQGRIREIADAVKGSEKLILATDPDREGEAISWHLLEALKKRRALKKDVDVERVVFNAITKSAVTTAMAEPRQIDDELVEAYLARRALDYLVGFNLSPVLWRKLPGSRSAGRVQSVALRIVCQRELEIETFVPQEYWQVQAKLRAPNGTDFDARLYALDGETLKKFTLGDKGSADAALEAVKAGGYTVANVEAKPVKRNPPPPFITSTLQQEASRKLGFSAKRTMQAAQKLYEEGRITYMRTDGVNMAEEAYAAARDQIKADYGANYLPEKTRRYSSKQKNAQEAHEAVRPTDFSIRPDDYKSSDGDLWKLYALIWRRAVASQME